MSEGIRRDPRDVLARDKHFSLRPRPLEQWLWRAGVPPSAERVFWLHWQEGMAQRDWCSAIPLKRVAMLCALDISSVTRAYQLLAKLQLIRRTDPGRDPTRPFEQAVAITEVRLPHQLVQALGSFPDRRRLPAGPRSATPNTGTTRPFERAQAAEQETPQHSPQAPPSAIAASEAPPDPFEGLDGRERLRALAQLLAPMSAVERRLFDEALRIHRTHMPFDADSRLSAEQRGRVLQFLAVAAPRTLPATGDAAAASRAVACTGPRKLSVFELARLRRDLQLTAARADCAELLREVVWSIEEGALRRFTRLHAMRIALKKIRESAWTRPNRMPPNWARHLSNAANETCGYA
jgi:hypothetical protein